MQLKYKVLYYATTKFVANVAKSLSIFLILRLQFKEINICNLYPDIVFSVSTDILLMTTEILYSLPFCIA